MSNAHAIKVLKYSPEQVSKVLELAKELSTSAIEKQTGIPHSTVRSWLNAHKAGRAFVFPKKELTEDRPMKQVLEDEDRVVYLKDRLKSLEKKYTARTRETAQLSALVDAIREVTPTRSPVPAPKIPKPKKGRTRESAVLALSCLHWGENVDAEETGGISTYNEVIARKRFNYTIDKAIHIVQDILTGYQIDRLYVLGLGDFISGMIHKELEISNESSVVEQVLDCTDVLQSNLLKLCQVFPHVEFTGVVGNHGRLDPKKYFKMRAVKNYDYMIYSFLQRLLAKQPNLTFNIPKSFWFIQPIENLRFLMIHGDQIRCFKPSAEVTLSNGTRCRIEDITKEDAVLCHDGKSRNVVNKFQYNRNDKMTIIEAAYLPERTWELTPNHKVLVVPKQKIVCGHERHLAKEGQRCSLSSCGQEFEIPHPEWIEAGQVSPGDYLVVPRPVVDQDITKLQTDRFLKHIETHPNQKHIPPILNVNENLGLIIGQYLADGCTCGRNKKVKGSNYNNITEVVFHEDETVFWEEFLNAWQEVFNDRPKLIRRGDISIRAQRIHAYSNQAAAVIEGLAGRGSYAKCLHEDVLKWPVNVLKKLLVGYLRGDRHTYRYKWSIRNYSAHQVEATTVSKSLGEQIYWIALRCGYAPSFKTRKRSGIPVYKLRFYGSDAQELGSLTQRDFKGKDPAQKNRRMVISCPEFVLVPVVAAWREDYHGSVYDLEIDGQHSYTVSGAAVHNSWMGLPFYGLVREYLKWRALAESYVGGFHHLICGHFHTPNMITVQKDCILIVGSLKGGDEYSLGALSAASDPTQLLFGVNPKHGITWSYQINSEQIK